MLRKMIQIGSSQFASMHHRCGGMMRAVQLAVVCVGLVVVAAGQVQAGAILSGFNANTLARNDDLSTGLVNIGFTTNFFGVTRTQLYVNNNGNVTFDAPLGTFTPFDLTSTGSKIIAPFFADVDTRVGGNPVTYGTGSFGGRTAFGVNWVDVDYYFGNALRTNLNSFQLLLVDRSDIAAGDFDIIFNYDEIQWESGEASGGDANGLGGSSARVGFSNGTGNPGTSLELSGSAVNGAFLDGGPNSLISNRLNSSVDGRYIFTARNGTVSGTVPEPASLAVFGIGACVAGFGAARRRRREKLQAATA